MSIIVKGRYSCPRCGKSHTVVNRKLDNISGRWFMCSNGKFYYLNEHNEESLVNQSCTGCGSVGPWKGNQDLSCNCGGTLNLELKKGG